MLKKGISRRKRAKQGRLDNKGPCGNGWTWESLAFFTLRRESQRYLHGKALLEPFDLRGGLILADKGYDSNKFVRWIEEGSGIIVIPSRITAKNPITTDWYTYKERHLVENLFLKRKNNLRFATRYEKKALYFRAIVCLACILVWLL